jgi:hypothetical protein
MDIAYTYFKDPAKQVQKQESFEAFLEKQDSIAAGKVPGEPIKTSNGYKLVTAYGLFHVSAGNTKVNFPTINLESGLSCSSRKQCGFDFQNKRDGKSKKPLCYAQKLEGSRPAMFNAKLYQAAVAERISGNASVEEMEDISKSITEIVDYLGRDRFVRFSEVGDIGPQVADFAHVLIKTLVAAGKSPYLYTKRPDIEQEALRAAGATVVISETDFVVVNNEQEAKDLNLPVCPSVCGGPGGCFRCPLGKKSAVIKH